MKHLIMLLGIISSSVVLQATVISLKTLDDYTKLYMSSKPMVTLYSAEWCGPCRQTKPHFYAVAEVNPDITFCIVDTGIAALGDILTDLRSIPTIIYSHNGKKVKQESGGQTRHQLEHSLKRFRKTFQHRISKSVDSSPKKVNTTLRKK